MADTRDPNRQVSWWRALMGWPLVIILGALVISVYIFSFGTSEYAAEEPNQPLVPEEQGQVEPYVPVTPPTTDQVPGSVLVIVQDKNQIQWIGKQADFNDQQVLEVVKPGVFWMGDQNGRMLVVAQDAATTTDIKERDYVDVVGTIKRFPDPEEARQKWGLLQPASALQGEQLYVDATNVVKFAGRPDELQVPGGENQQPRPQPQQ